MDNPLSVHMSNLQNAIEMKTNIRETLTSWHNVWTRKFDKAIMFVRRLFRHDSPDEQSKKILFDVISKNTMLNSEELDAKIDQLKRQFFKESCLISNKYYVGGYSALY